MWFIYLFLYLLFLYPANYFRKKLDNEITKEAGDLLDAHYRNRNIENYNPKYLRKDMI